jgi:tRNA pseudouridine38-40 synthase
MPEPPQSNMHRYFLELSYKGANYAGFQVQKNANTIQAEVERVLQIYYRKPFVLTGSSRTDAGVHALQNFFHFDNDVLIIPKDIYNLNAILPADIVIKRIFITGDTSHCRFDAVSREYNYYIYTEKNPFIADRAYYFPYTLNVELMQEAAGIVKHYTDFTSFSKRNTQVKTFECSIIKSRWVTKDECLVYNVEANRFLRGMVRALTATMLKIGREKLSIADFKRIIEAKDCTAASFAVPSHGLFLQNVNFK